MDKKKPRQITFTIYRLSQTITKFYFIMVANEIFILTATLEICVKSTLIFIERILENYFCSSLNFNFSNYYT